MIAGFEHRWQVEAQLAAFEHERKGAQTDAHREAIAAQEAIFQAELERMDKEGDYREPRGPESMGTSAWVGTARGAGASSYDGQASSSRADGAVP
jgi:hypothetical protein